MDKTKLKSLLIPTDITIKQAMQKLGETQEKILFVVGKKDKLLGTINDGDIRRGLINGSNFDDNVGNIMHRDFISISMNTKNIENRAKQLMLDTKIEQIPVLNDNGEIVNVILWTDILREKKDSKSKHLHKNQVVIMAGGKGTRLDPFTKILPKPLIPIGNKPVIELIMDRFIEQGVDSFYISINYKKEYLKLYLKESSFPYTIDWVEEDDFLGTAGGISLLKDKVKDTFFVINCDSLLDVDFEEILGWHKEHNAAITIIGCHNEVKIPFGVLKLSNGRLEKIVEKPVHDVIINTGAYVMEPQIISFIPDGKP